MPFVQTTFLIFLTHSSRHTSPKLLRSRQGPVKHPKRFHNVAHFNSDSWDLQKHLSTLISQPYLDSIEFEITNPSTYHKSYFTI